MPFIENNEKFLRRVFGWAAPVYGAVTGVRNFLFDSGFCKTYIPNLPVICVGNLCAGGSGKTPLTEYLIRLLLTMGEPASATGEPTPAGRRSIGLVTRGYGRKQKGSFLAEPGMNAAQIGDEAVQYLDGFKDAVEQGRLHLYLSAHRARAIQTLQETHPGLQACLLDDAFQHRQVDAGFNILVSDFNKPYFKDRLMPRGTLRESRKGSRRAQIVVFSKCPRNLSPEQKEEFLWQAALEPYQKAFFTYPEYGEFVPVTATSATEASAPAAPPKKILLFTGIANPQPIEDYLKQKGYEILAHRRFADHHFLTRNEAEEIAALHRRLSEKNGPVQVLTTRKDYSRLRNTPNFSYICGLPLAYLPVQTGFLYGQELEFNAIMANYIKNYG